MTLQLFIFCHLASHILLGVCSVKSKKNDLVISYINNGKLLRSCFLLNIFSYLLYKIIIYF
jgi:hypothetical protein